MNTETGVEKLDQLEDERAFAAEDVECAVTAPQSNEAILREIARYATEHEEQTGRFPKTDPPWRRGGPQAQIDAFFAGLSLGFVHGRDRG